jgi:hypothetical protein
MSIRPDLTGMTAEQIEYVESLEKIAKSLSNNGAVKFMAALNKKMEVVAEQLDGMSIDINMSDKEDKTLDRLLKMADLGGSFVNAFKAFNQEYGIQEKEDDRASAPLAEKLARKNKLNGNTTS